MLFSKSFGYALKGLLYVALMHEQQKRVQVDQIATQLALPRHFTGKILKRLVKEGLLISTKGPNGGFSVTHTTLTTSVFGVLVAIQGDASFKNCVLQLKECSTQNPCPLHDKMQAVKETMMSVFMTTTIGELLGTDRDKLLRSLSSEENFSLSALNEKDLLFENESL